MVTTSNMQTQSVLETQRVMFAEIIRCCSFVGFMHLFLCFSIADSIIEHQNDIKKKTEALSEQNTELQTKSQELQEVLRSSQAQLLSQTSIPLELINSLAAAVSEMKNCHQEQLERLLVRFTEAQAAFQKQRDLLVDHDKESPPSEIKDIAPKSAPEPVAATGKKVPDDEVEDDKIKAWKSEKRETKVVTILEEKEAGPELPGADSPASQSEVVTAAFLASLTKNMTPASAGSSESRYNDW